MVEKCDFSANYGLFSRSLTLYYAVSCLYSILDARNGCLVASEDAFESQREKEMLMQKSKIDFIFLAKLKLSKFIKIELQYRKKTSHFRESSKGNFSSFNKKTDCSFLI